jgi:pimeloyl-[acyl-carrier protein] methyl ester esterase
MGALYYETHGQGRDLVLLHGWSLNLRVWDPLVQRLQPQFRVITVDLPGHGRSDWDRKAMTPAAQAWQVHETLAPLTGRYTLLGWSLGGQMALDLAAALPTAIERLVLISSTPKFLASASWRFGMPRPLLARLANRVHDRDEYVVRDFLRLAALGSKPRTTQRVF